MNTKKDVEILINYILNRTYGKTLDGTLMIKYDYLLPLLKAIKKDLDKLDEINAVWHTYEPNESIDFNAKRLQETCDFLNFMIKRCDKAENKIMKLLKAIEILKDNLHIEFDDENNAVRLKRDENDECDYTIMFVDSKKDYKLLKEVLGYE